MSIGGVSVEIDAVVFDFDGLMLDTEVPVYEAWRAAFESYGGVPPTLDEWGAIIGTDSDDQELLDLLFATAARPGHLDRLGLRGHFEHVMCAGDTRPGKPAPDTYLAACAALGVETQRALAVE